MSVGLMMAGIAGADGAAITIRQDDDFYPTPPDVTLAFLRAEYRTLRGRRIWDPACGDGALLKVAGKLGFATVGTDLVDRRYGQGNRDFLKEGKTRGDAIITNPPFHMAREFIEHALSLRSAYVAMLLKATYWHAKSRRPLFNLNTPSRIYPLTWRPDFMLKGAPTMDCIWCVWERDERSGHCRYMPPLIRPSACEVSS